MGGEEGQAVGDADVEQVGILVVKRLLAGIEDTECHNRLPVIALIQALHRRQLHGLVLGYGDGAGVTRDHRQHDADNTHPGTDFEAALAMVIVALLEQHPAAHTAHKGTS